MSPVLIMEMSVLPPAPMEETTFRFSRLASTSRFIFELRPSMASTTTSMSEDSSVSRLPAFTNELWICILQPG